MSWDDFDYFTACQRHVDRVALNEIIKGRKARWLSANGSIAVWNMTDDHVKNCLLLDGLLPEWRALFEEELKIRMAEDFEDDPE